MLENQTISSKEFAAFQKLIYDVAGISMSDAKKVLMVGRLSKRLRHHKFTTFDQYYKYVTGGTDPQEFQLMVDLLTTNETYFFREEKHFDFLRKLIAAHPRGRSFDIWSGASSTGEEIYTICMVLADELGVDGNWTVTGSDISQSVLKIAEAGHYSLEKTRGLPPEYLRKYCLKGVRTQEGTFMIDPRLKSHTRFRQINLNTNLPEIGPFDLIFLRNVMIYFDAATKRSVVARLAKKIRPGGHLIIGHSETLTGINEELQSVQPTIYRKPA
ncbi:MAG TPA: protein-glutamate O-methyltransferase CheR [Rhodocyclaceae bacterium]|nr:protein-glutamate O-methyltransferase CheR [Rhodocyclaceae bacterium]